MIVDEVSIGIRLLRTVNLVVGNEGSVINYEMVFFNTSFHIVNRVNNSAYLGNHFQCVLEILRLRMYND